MLNRIYSGAYQVEDYEMDMAWERLKRRAHIDRTETSYGGTIGNYRCKRPEDDATDSIISMPGTTKMMRKRKYL